MRAARKLFGVGVLGAALLSVDHVGAGRAATTTVASTSASTSASTPDAPCAALPDGLRLVLAGHGTVVAHHAAGAQPLSRSGLVGDPQVAGRAPDGTLWVQSSAGVGRITAAGAATMVLTGATAKLASVGWLSGRSAAVLLDTSTAPFEGAAGDTGAVLVAFQSETPVPIHPVTFGPGTIVDASIADTRLLMTMRNDASDTILPLGEDRRVHDDWYNPVDDATDAKVRFRDPRAAAMPDGRWALSWVEGPETSADRTTGWMLSIATLDKGAPVLRLPIADAASTLVRSDFDGRFWVGTFATASSPETPTRVLAVDVTSTTAPLTDLRCAAGTVATIDRVDVAPASPAPTVVATTAAETTAPPPPPPPPPATKPKPTAPAIRVSYRCGKLVEQPARYPILRCRKGYIVWEVQWRLRQLGYPLEVDSQFGPGTETAVRMFQRDHRLRIDGGVGPQTWRVLVNLTGAVGWDTNRNGMIDPWEVVYD